MTAARPHIRPAREEDLPAIRPILVAHGNDGPVVTADVVGPYLVHLIRHHRALVTELDGALVAFGAVAFAGRVAHLADLFVAPDRLGHGIGRPLLDALLAGTTERTTFASDDPRALRSYVRAGMTPLWPNLYLRGEGHALSGRETGLELRGAGARELAELESVWTGVHRPVDHEHWATSPEAEAFVIVDRGEIVAFAYGRVRQAAPVRAVTRLLVRSGVDPVAPIVAALARIARGAPVSVGIPGPSPALPVLLEAGFRIEDRDTFMASDPALVDPVRLLPNSGLL